MPDDCPVCGTPVARDPARRWRYCTNAACPAQVRELIEHFASRGAMDIEGSARRWPTRSSARASSTMPPRSTTSPRRRLVSCRSSRKRRNPASPPSARPLRTSWQASAPANSARSRTSSSRSASATSATKRRASSQRTSAASTPSSPRPWRPSPRSRASARSSPTASPRGPRANRIATSCAPHRRGIDPREEPHAPVSGLLTGLTLVVTGRLEGIARKQAEDLVRELGGKVGSSVSKSTTALVVGEEGGHEAGQGREARRAHDRRSDLPPPHGRGAIRPRTRPFSVHTPTPPEPPATRRGLNSPHGRAA